MSGSTPELNLKTAVDSDDTADYLTISLANSLQTIDALYNNLTGHTHNGTAQGGPIGTIPAGAIPDGSVTSAKIADGTIATADLADAAVTNAKLASDTARANLLTNGGFEIWQRGAGPFTANGIQSADRWQQNIGSSSTVQTDRIAAATVVAGEAGYVLRLTYTHSSASNLYQYLNDQIPNLVGRTISLSMRVHSAVANAVRLSLVVIGGSGSAAGTFHPGGSTYQVLTATTTVGSGATAFAVGLEFLVSGTYYVDNAMLVVGSVAADYAPLHPADDLARCLRYYQRWSTMNQIIGIGSSGSTTQHNILVNAQAQPMAVTPSSSSSPPATLTLLSSTLGATSACSTLSSSNASPTNVMFVAGTAAAFNTAGAPCYLMLPSGSYVSLEANP